MIIHLPSMDQTSWSERIKPKALIESTPSTISGRSRAVKVTYEGRKGMVTRQAIPLGGLSIYGNKSGGHPISSQQKTCFFCGKVSSYEWRTGELPFRNQCQHCGKIRDAGHQQRKKLADAAAAREQDKGDSTMDDDMSGV